jgi:hypothetical protein
MEDAETKHSVDSVNCKLGNNSNNKSLVDMFEVSPPTVTLKSTAELPEESFDEMMLSIGKSFQQLMSISSDKGDDDDCEKNEVLPEVRLPMSCLCREEISPNALPTDTAEEEEGLGLDLDELAKHLLPPRVPKQKRLAASEVFLNAPVENARPLTKLEPSPCFVQKRVERPTQTMSLRQPVAVITPEQRRHPGFPVRRAQPVPQYAVPDRQNVSNQQWCTGGGVGCYSTQPNVDYPQAVGMMNQPPDELEQQLLAASERLKQVMQRSMSSRFAVKQQGGFHGPTTRLSL